MRASEAQLGRVADLLVKRLLAIEAVDLRVPPERLRERFTAVLVHNRDEEAEIERLAQAEAEKLVRQGAPGVRREELDLRRVEQLVKQRIAKQRGFAL